MLAACETLEAAQEFMKHDFVLVFDDETEDNATECVHPDEMFIDTDDTPFSDAPTLDELKYIDDVLYYKEYKRFWGETAELPF